MITCNIDIQQRLLSFFKRNKYSTEKDIVDFAKAFTNNSEINSLSTLISSFTGQSKQDLKDFLAANGLFNEKMKEVVTTTSFVSNIESNFTLAPIDPLFSTFHVAKSYFESSSNNLIMTASYVGDEADSNYPKSSANFNTNLNRLKNTLFKTIIDYLIKHGKLTESDYYDSKEYAGKTFKVFTKDLYSLDGFNQVVYETHYRKVIKTLEDFLLGPSKEYAMALPILGRYIPKLKGDILKASDREKFDAYNAAVLLLNFDAILLKKYKDIVEVNLSKFNSFEVPLAGDKYIKKVKGLVTEYWDEDDLTSNGVEKIQDKLTEKLIAIIPIYKNGEFSGRYFKNIDLSSLGSILQDFETKNVLQLAELSGWKTLEEDPVEALKWYLNSILEAYENKFLNTIVSTTNLNPNAYLIFKDKIDIVQSLQLFLKSIEKKEANSEIFSFARVITQAMVNSTGASYTTDFGTKQSRVTKEMHTHNSEKVQLQQGIYNHLKNNLTNWKKFDLTPNELAEFFEDSLIVGIKKLSYKLLNIQLSNEAAENLLTEWTSEIDDESKKKETLLNLFNKIVKSIFPKKVDESLIVKDYSSFSEEELIAEKERINAKKESDYKESVFETIEKNEKQILDLHFDEVVGENEIIADIAQIKTVQSIIEEKMKTLIVRTITTIHTQTGKRISSSVIPSLGQNDITVLKERLLIEKNPEYNRSYKNYFTTEGGLLGTTIKLEGVGKGTIKDATKYNVIENFQSHFEFDFLAALRNDSPSVNIIVGNYADKSRIIDKKIDKFAKWKDKILISKSFDSSDVVLSTDEIWNIDREQSQKYYTDLTDQVFKDYLTILPADLAADFNKPTSSFDKKVEIINQFLNTFTVDEFWQLTVNIPNVNFVKELHYSVYSNKLSFNQNIYAYYKIYSNQKYFEEFKTNQKEALVYKLLDSLDNQNILLSAAKVLKINTSRKKVDPTIFNKMLQSIGIENKDYMERFVDNNGNHVIYILENNKIVLNPLLDKWLVINEFFRNEYLRLTVKHEYMHPVKKQHYWDAPPKTQSEFFKKFTIESGARLAQMGKRNVAYTGTTELPSRNHRFGVVDDINVAVINDLNVPIATLGGNVVNQDIHDGGSYLSYTYSRMLDASYPTKGFGSTKKQLGTFITEFGSALKKDAEHVISNEKIRIT